MTNLLGTGLAVQLSGPMNTYGDGSNNTVKHYYAGKEKPKKRKCKKKLSKDSVK